MKNKAPSRMASASALSPRALRLLNGLARLLDAAATNAAHSDCAHDAGVVAHLYCSCDALWLAYEALVDREVQR